MILRICIIGKYIILQIELYFFEVFRLLDKIYFSLGVQVKCTNWAVARLNYLGDDIQVKLFNVSLKHHSHWWMDFHFMVIYILFILIFSSMADTFSMFICTLLLRLLGWMVLANHEWPIQRKIVQVHLT